MPVWKREMPDMAGHPFERLSYDLEYDQGLSYLYNLQKFGIKFGLSKTENLLRAFNNPAKDLILIHIGRFQWKGFGSGHVVLHIQSSPVIKLVCLPRPI